jgi:hypothetical protein
MQTIGQHSKIRVVPCGQFACLFDTLNLGLPVFKRQHNDIPKVFY